MFIEDDSRNYDEIHLLWANYSPGPRLGFKYTEGSWGELHAEIS